MNDADKTKQQLIDELTELRQSVAKLDHAEAMRQQTQESYQVLVDHSLQGMAIYQGGRFVFCNARLAEILGRSIDALFTLRFDNGDLAEFVHPDDLARIEGHLGNRIAGESAPSTYEARVLKPNGEVCWVEAHTVAIEYAGQPAVQVVVIDITEREQMAQALRESQTILTEAQRIAHIGNWVFYLDSGELHWSPELYRIFGRDRQELDPDQNFLWIHPDDRERVRDAAATYLREKGRMDIEYRILRVDGEERIIHSRGEVICDPQGNALKTVGTVQDVTERRQAEMALRQSHYLLERSQQMANLGSWQWDLSTGRMAWSQQMHRIHGTDSDQYPEGVPIEEAYRLIHPDDLKMAQENSQLRLEGSTPDPLEYRIIRPDGVVRRVMGDGHVMVDDSGKPVSMVGIVQDVTERKEAEQQALALLVERERSRILAQFIQDASHEFRTPLSMINLNAHALRDSTDPDQRLKRLQRIEALVRDITGLVDNLVTMARLDSGVPLKMDVMNIGGIVDHVKTTKHGAIRKARVRVVTESTIPEDLMIRGSLDFLYQALASLLDNAIRYTPPAGIITLRAYQRDSQIILEVQDTGSGIDNQTLPHIFARFYRANQTHSTGGFGLGLPIAQKIVERHNGTIEVESKLGKGSVFRIVLNV